MNKLLVVFVFLLSSCSGIHIKNKRLSPQESPQASLEIETKDSEEALQPLSKVTSSTSSADVDATVEEDLAEADDNDINEELLVKNMEVLTPDLFIDGVAHPRNEAKNVTKNKLKIYYLDGAEELKLENNYFDIPVVYNSQVKKWIKYFTTRGRKYFSNYVERAGRYAPMIGNILETNGLPRDLIFLAMAESGFNNHAKSIASAMGPWQFMPATGKSYSLNQNWFIDERKDPIKATIAAAQYLGKLYKDFGQWEVATAAYNAGEGKLGRAIKKYRTDNFWKISKGKYLKSETKNYVPKIMALAIIGKNLKTFGFTDLEFRAPLDFEEISVGPLTDISKLSEALGLEYDALKKLNPEILRWYTPPNVKEYKLRLPIDSAHKYASCCLKQDFTVIDFQKYKVKKNTTLVNLSRQMQLKNTSVLADINSLSPKARLSKGDIIHLPFRVGDKLSKKHTYYADLYAKKPKAKKMKFKLHKVQRGESLHSIAKKHKTTIKRIIAYNSSIPSSKKIFPGTKLIIR